MAGVGRGRGRPQTNPNPPLPEPDPKVVQDLLQQEDKASESGQFDDHEPAAPSCPDHQSPTSEPPQPRPRDPDRGSSPPSSAGEPIGGPAESVETSSSRPAESKTVSEIKAALKSGMQVQGRLNPEVKEFVPNSVPSSASSTKLNPTAAPFVPRPQSTLDPTSPEFTPGSSKHAPMSASTSSTSLDPNSPTFVPEHSTSNSSLNAGAREFVPGEQQPSMVNGDPSLDPLEEDDFLLLEQEEVPFLTVEDIMRRFNAPVEAKSDVENALLLLKTSAEMLLMVSVYPEVFERQKLELVTRLEAWPPSHEAVSRVGAMMVHWGIAEPGLRYGASKIFNILFEAEENNRKPLLAVLQQRFKQQSGSDIDTEQQIEEAVNFAYFAADLYSRLRIRVEGGEQPVGVLGIAIYNLLNTMLKLRDERAILGVCNVLKLTGSLLQDCPKSEGKMDVIVKALQGMLNDTHLTISSLCVSLIGRVQELYQGGWSQLPSQTGSFPAAPSPHQPLCDDAAATDYDYDYDDMFVQPPVQNREEWEEFVDENDQLIEDDNNPDFANGGEGGLELEEEGCDPEIEQEFEAFIQEMEEHLMMQDGLDDEQGQQ